MKKVNELILPDIEELKQESHPVVAQAQSLVVQTLQQHEGALLLLKRIRSGFKTLKGRLDPLCAQANKIHKMATGLRKEALTPWDHAEAVIMGKLDYYETEQRQIAEVAAAEAEAEMHAREQERGGDPELLPTIEPEPEVTKVAGVSQSTHYKAVVVDIVLLAEYVAKNTQFMGLIQANQPALNALARAQQDNLKIPGVKIVTETRRSIRTA